MADRVSDATELGAVKKRIETSIVEHKRYQSLDGLTFNGMTLFVLGATTATTLLAGDAEFVTIVRILSGLATLFIAVERTLAYGERWRFHREMRHGYVGILNKLAFYEVAPTTYTPEQKVKLIEQVFADLRALGMKEAEIPGSARITTSPSPSP